MLQETLNESKFSYMAFCGLKEKSRMKFAPRYNPVDIIRVVCEYFDIPEKMFLSRSRVTRLVTARHIYFLLARRNTRLPLKEIGRFCGRLDHTTVLHGINAISGLLTRPNEHVLRDDVKRIEELLP